MVLAVSSTDEAALWIGALLRTCAPATGRYLSYSVLQRILTPSDVEILLQSRIDVACVPRQDLTNMAESRPGLVVIDPHESGAVAPAPTREARARGGVASRRRRRRGDAWWR